MQKNIVNMEKNVANWVKLENMVNMRKYGKHGEKCGEYGS